MHIQEHKEYEKNETVLCKYFFVFLFIYLSLNFKKKTQQQCKNKRRLNEFHVIVVFTRFYLKYRNVITKQKSEKGNFPQIGKVILIKRVS